MHSSYPIVTISRPGSPLKVVPDNGPGTIHAIPVLIALHFALMVLVPDNSYFINY